MKKLFAAAGLLLVAGCSSSSNEPTSNRAVSDVNIASQPAAATVVPVQAGSPGTVIQNISIIPMTNANLCTQLGGSGEPPTISIFHEAAPGKSVNVRMYDKLSSGRIFEHRSTTVALDPSGTTNVSFGFLPPCNTTNGQANSVYTFDFTVDGTVVTREWARFDSASKTIQ